ncbi:hypothetical protein LCGC14_2734460 [marine sediment metagenome]|uniref:Uncharacterized protein n=1 Tax=marine sediment metagenome TaxID=412755 RepID=A0A0F8Z688_9ZZZZ
MEKFEELKGKTLKSIKGNVGNDEMVFTTEEGEIARLHYVPD